MRSITRLNRMIEIAKGQMPAPKSSWAWTLSRPNSVGQSPGSLTRNARVMNAKDVVMRAMKQPQNRRMSGADEETAGVGETDAIGVAAKAGGDGAIMHRPAGRG